MYDDCIHKLNCKTNKVFPLCYCKNYLSMVDPEIKVLGMLVKCLEKLDPVTRVRILWWARDKYCSR